MKVYLLWHSHDTDAEIDVKLIGVYSAEVRAVDARERFRQLTGFRDYPAGFSIDSYEVNVDHWQSGFVTTRFGDRGEPNELDAKDGEIS